MALSTYEELKTSIGTWLARSDLTSVIPDLIALAEVEINNTLRSKSSISTATITPSQSDDYVALPTGHLETISFVDDLKQPLYEHSIEQIQNKRYGASTNRPSRYALTDVIEFDCVANNSYSFEMIYYKRLDLATDGTNQILTNYPNLYLFGALAMAEPYLKNDSRIATWVSLFQQTLKSTNTRENRSRTTLRSDLFTMSRFDINKGN